MKHASLRHKVRQLADALNRNTASAQDADRAIFDLGGRPIFTATSSPSVEAYEFRDRYNSVLMIYANGEYIAESVLISRLRKG